MELKQFYRNIRNSSAGDLLYETPLSLNLAPVDRDKFRGCLLGGAVGDALGYAVEFIYEDAIFKKYGPRGITEMEVYKGKALISDDTQMTMFTANGLLNGLIREKEDGVPVFYPGLIACAYQQWYRTQMESFRQEKGTGCWLMNLPELFSTRAPGNTCLREISSGCQGTPEGCLNESKGCGGVMRVAPVGLFFPKNPLSILAVDMLAADAAALTHGHPMGYVPAAMLAHIVRLAACTDGVSLKEIVVDSQYAMKRIFGFLDSFAKFMKLIDKAVTLAESATPDLDAIHVLGEGWVGDEALAIAIYCALKYENDFEKAMIAAVNHNGDSDSTGAIVGNILGAHLGASAIPKKYLANLELKDAIAELADDLYSGCPEEMTELWKQKYAQASYRMGHAL